MLATSSVVAKRLISVVGRCSLTKLCSACAGVMPCSWAVAFVQLERISELVGPGTTALTATPVPATRSANPRETPSAAVLGNVGRRLAAADHHAPPAARLHPGQVMARGEHPAHHVGLEQVERFAVLLYEKVVWP